VLASPLADNADTNFPQISLFRPTRTEVPPTGRVLYSFTRIPPQHSPPFFRFFLEALFISTWNDQAFLALRTNPSRPLLSIYRHPFQRSVLMCTFPYGTRHISAVPGLGLVPTAFPEQPTLPWHTPFHQTLCLSKFSSVQRLYSFAQISMLPLSWSPLS